MYGAENDRPPPRDGPAIEIDDPRTALQYQPLAPDSERPAPSDRRPTSHWSSVSSWRSCTDDRRMTELAASAVSPFSRPSSAWSPSSGRSTVTLPPSICLSQVLVPPNPQAAPSEALAVSLVDDRFVTFPDCKWPSLCLETLPHSDYPARA
jgi:hypothetical protein